MSVRDCDAPPEEFAGYEYNLCIRGMGHPCDQQLTKGDEVDTHEVCLVSNVKPAAPSAESPIDWNDCTWENFASAPVVDTTDEFSEYVSKLPGRFEDGGFAGRYPVAVLGTGISKDAFIVAWPDAKIIHYAMITPAPSGSPPESAWSAVVTKSTAAGNSYVTAASADTKEHLIAKFFTEYICLGGVLSKVYAPFKVVDAKLKAR